MAELNPLAKLILNCFEETSVYDSYITEQKEILLKHDSVLTSLVYAVYKLDADNRVRLADKIGVPVEYLDDFETLLDKIFKLK